MSDHGHDLIVVEGSDKSCGEKDLSIRPAPGGGLIAGEHLNAYRIVDHPDESIRRLLSTLQLGTPEDAPMLMDPPRRRCRSSCRPRAAPATT